MNTAEKLKRMKPGKILLLISPCIHYQMTGIYSAHITKEGLLVVQYTDAEAISLPLPDKYMQEEEISILQVASIVEGVKP